MRNSGRTFLLLILVVILIAGGGAAFVFLRGHHRDKAPEKTYSLALADLTVNLADSDRPHHLSASIALAIKGPDPEKVAAECDPQIRDAVLMVMSQHAYHELLSTEGKQALKEQIGAEVGKTLAERKVTVEDVLFTTFLMD